MKPLDTCLLYTSKHDLDTFWDEYRRLTMPHRYKVDLSDELYTLKQNLLRRQGQCCLLYTSAF